MVVVLVAVRAREVAAPDRNQMRRDGCVRKAERLREHSRLPETPLESASSTTHPNEIHSHGIHPERACHILIDVATVALVDYPRSSLELSNREPAIRRGKNALSAVESWPTFIFPASGKGIANPFASSAFLLPSLSRRLEGSPLLNTNDIRSRGKCEIKGIVRSLGLIGLASVSPAGTSRSAWVLRIL